MKFVKLRIIWSIDITSKSNLLKFQYCRETSSTIIYPCQTILIKVFQHLHRNKQHICPLVRINQAACKHKQFQLYWMWCKKCHIIYFISPDIKPALTYPIKLSGKWNSGDLHIIQGTLILYGVTRCEIIFAQ